MLLVWSTADKDGLRRLASSFAAHWGAETTSVKKSTTYIRDLAYTLACKRSMLRWRSFVIASSAEELQSLLEKDSLNAIRSENVPKVGFVFTGQGAQWNGMGKELLKYTVFQQSFSNAQEILAALGCEWSVFGKTVIKVRSIKLTLCRTAPDGQRYQQHPRS